MLSVVSPVVHLILKIALVRRSAKLPEQLKLVSVVGLMKGLTKRRAIVGDRHVDIATNIRSGARIG